MMIRSLLFVWLVGMLAVIEIADCKAQYVTIPDSNFVECLTDQFPSCMADELLDTSCGQIEGLTLLYCQDYGITDLTGIQYFNNLLTLYCDQNELTSLPTLPAALLELHCQDNQLNTLPPLPTSLEHLSCGNNQLTVLPTLPSTLYYLNSSSNQLTTLPELPPALRYLLSANNQLTILPPLPDTLKVFHVAFNQNLLCMPLLLVFTGSATGNNFLIYNTGINCLPNVIEHEDYVAAIDTMPICGPGNVNGCEFLSSEKLSTNFILNVYPNPFTAELKLNITGITSTTQLFVTNALGQRIHQAVISPGNSVIYQTVEMSGFPPGVYAVTLSAGGERISRRVIKQ